MIIEEEANIGEEIHIWKNGKLLFEGKYLKENPYAQCEVFMVGYDTLVNVDCDLYGKDFRCFGI